MNFETGSIPTEIINSIDGLSIKIGLKDGERELLSRLAIEFTAPIITETPELKEEFLRTYAVGFTTFDFVEGIFDEHLAEPFALLISNDTWVTPDVKQASAGELNKWLNDPYEEEKLKEKLVAARNEDLEIANDLGWSTRVI